MYKEDLVLNKPFIYMFNRELNDVIDNIKFRHYGEQKNELLFILEY